MGQRNLTETLCMRKKPTQNWFPEKWFLGKNGFKVNGFEVKLVSKEPPRGKKEAKTKSTKMLSGIWINQSSMEPSMIFMKINYL